MELFNALELKLCPGGNIIVLVGGGGKTSSLFALGSSAAARGGDALLCTTTHIRDPRAEPGRSFDRVAADGFFAAPPQGSDAAALAAARIDAIPAAEDQAGSRGRRGRITVLGGGILPARDGDCPLLAPIDTAWPGLLAPRYSLCAVEADGSRGLPLKAPNCREPAMPERADIVIGLVGLECLGRPMDSRSVHRPELFGPLAGCASSENITIEHIIALARSPQGIFKNCPRGARRVLLLNKAELCGRDPLMEGSACTAADGTERRSAGVSSRTALSRAARAAAEALAAAAVADLVLLASLRPDGVRPAAPQDEVLLALKSRAGRQP